MDRPGPQHRLRPTAWTAAVLTVAALTACSPAAGDDASSPGVVVDGPVVANSTHSDSSMAAYVGGTLTYDGTCLTLDDEPVLWPVGTTWDEQASTLLLPEGDTITAGSALYGGGGHTPLADDTTNTDADRREGAALLEQCLGPSGLVTNFNTGARLSSDPQPS